MPDFHPKKVLISGGAGFIGSYLVKYLLKKYPKLKVVCLDKLTYCGDLSRLKDVARDPRYRFVKSDILDQSKVLKAMKGCDAVIHAAAESHVDRSLLSGVDFFQTNVTGTFVMLQSARQAGVKRFLHVSTDEVYGSRSKGYFKETDRFEPTSPYSVSKSSADMLAMSYAKAYPQMSVMITRGANTYGPYQYPEKVIPLFVSNALCDQPLPVYGDGGQIRNWIHVEDHCKGLWTVLTRGISAQAYNVSSNDYCTNMELTQSILRILDKPQNLIRHVQDRLAHDRRYATSSAKLMTLGWQQQIQFKKALEPTVLWYQQNSSWWRKIKNKSADFQAYYKKAYKGR